MNRPLVNWNLEQWLYHLENQHLEKIQLGLVRVKIVGHLLKVLAPQATVITVAGTNGKGSTVSALEAIYSSAGYAVGVYTSPHLLKFNERIRFNLQQISDEEACELFYQIEAARGEVELTYFEMTTLAALLYFQLKQATVIILEVGMGGRLDATNCVDADLAIITTIDFDHQSFLGNTLEAIGYEKAGILRKNGVLIYADTNPPESIQRVVSELKVDAYWFGEDYTFSEQENTWDLLDKQTPVTQLPKPFIQLKSASAAIKACQLLHSVLPIKREALDQAMRGLFVPGRLQFEEGEVSVLYDVSHNPQSVLLLAKTIKQLTKVKVVHAVFSALKDKDIKALILPLKDCVDYWYAAELTNARAIKGTDLLAIFREAEIFLDICYTSPFVAFNNAMEKAQKGDLVVVFGSFLTVSDVMTNQINS